MTGDPNWSGEHTIGVINHFMPAGNYLLEFTAQAIVTGNAQVSCRFFVEGGGPTPFRTFTSSTFNEVQPFVMREFVATLGLRVSLSCQGANGYFNGGPPAGILTATLVPSGQQAP